MTDEELKNKLAEFWESVDKIQSDRPELEMDLKKQCDPYPQQNPPQLIVNDEVLVGVTIPKDVVQEISRSFQTIFPREEE